MHLRHALLLTLLLPTSAFALALQPATLHITLTDAANHPIPNAVVSLTPEENLSAKPASATTDAAGHATLRQSADTVQWSDHLTITAPGFVPVHSYAGFFSDADIDLALHLNPAHSTTLALLTPAGKPAPNVPFNISYPYTDEYNNRLTANYFRQPSFITDAAGHYNFVHPPITGNFTLSLAGRQISLPDAPQLSVTLTPEELQLLTPPVSLHLTLLNPDHSPASNWLVAPRFDYEDHSGFIPGGTNNRIIVSQWQPFAPDGAALLNVPPRALVLLSPEGLPLLYCLDPQAWTPGTHDLTLTLPPIERTVAGRFIDPAGKPMPNIPIFANALRASSSGQFRIQAPDVPSAAALSGPFPEGPQPPQLLSDATGHFAIPLRFGMQPDSWQAGRPWFGPRYNPTPQIGDADTITLTLSPRSNTSPADLKDVILQFLDPAGNPLPADQLPYMSFREAPNNDPPLNFGPPTYHDRKGYHYFVRRNTPTLLIDTEEGLWKPGSFTLPLTDDDQQTLPIQFVDSQRNKPLSGTLLDAAGQPVANASISPFDETLPKNRGTDGRRYFNQLHATTDARGRFSFPAAPDNCKLSIFRSDPITLQNDIPMVEPFPITPDARDVTITLPAAGNLLIQLPPAIPPTLRDVLLTAQTPGPYGVSSYPLTLDPATHTLSTMPLLPGQYHIAPDALPALADFHGLNITITANHTTTIDLRNASLAPAAAPPTFAALTVLANGQPAPGAEVAIFTDADKTEPANNHLHPLTLDLTDSHGQVRFPISPNQPAIALARIRGQFAGSLPFTLTTNSPLTLTLQPDTTPTSPNDPARTYNPNPPPEPLADRATPLLHHSDFTWSNPRWLETP
ncbi:MAG TPA: carboxypeptidase-like regulatory domain-containing protein [Phycisphaerae bacterium]|nr:carboxypeptidase-like regulatory domain-containing protein [Phycisphaerae bacterium]